VFFCLAYIFILDYIDYKLRKESLINNIFSKKHLKSTLIFLIGAIASATVVDYFYGVKLFEIWLWNSYTTFNWIILYTIINFSFIILSYQTYKIIEYFISKKIKEKHIEIKNKQKTKRTFFKIGIIFLIIPLINYLLFKNIGTNYTMLLPFISILLFSDMFLLKYKTPVTIRVLKHDRKTIYSALLTTLFLVITHEIINIFSYEWIYINIPFINLQILTVPIAVIIGWIPLILFCISFVELIIEIDKKTRYKK
jgi:hypothetical protein